jgi:two-component system OmpR family response regulator
MARILVAEDDADIRHLVTQLLVDDGHEVAAVGDGASAVDKLLADPPDVAILDVMMPGLDGYSVLEHLQKAGLHSATKIMILSASSREQDYERSSSLGVCKRLSKPFDPDELLSAVNELLTLSMDEIRKRAEEERERAYLLSQLESIFSED